MTLANPLDVFLSWYEEAKCGAPIDPDIIALATATPEGRPSVRMVLFRGLREGGFSFFTNYQSRKGLELSENPFAAIVFYWAHVGKQVRIEGAVERLSAEASDTYFRQRPLLSDFCECLLAKPAHARRARVSQTAGGTRRVVEDLAGHPFA